MDSSTLISLTMTNSFELTNKAGFSANTCGKRIPFPTLALISVWSERVYFALSLGVWYTLDFK